MDNLVTCKRCGGNACYEQHIDENTQTWLCMGCGFTTSTVMKEGSKVVKDAIESAPELYKDLKFVADDNYVWLPATITLPGKGMVFIDGTNSKEWAWASVKAVELTEEDRKKFPDQSHKMDMSNVKHFGQKDFMDALENIGFFQLI